MREKMDLVAKTFQGLEDVLAEELVNLGAEDVTPGRRMVAFRGDKAMMYKANFCCRTALRILKPFITFKADDTDQLYEAAKKFEWDKLLSPDQTFSIDSTVYSDTFRHSKFVTYRVKDAIADFFMEKYGRRPSIRLVNADMLLNVHIANNDVIISLDSSGEPLYKRGYRVEQTEAPINEVLAAGLILKTGWRGDSNLIDPMCGSGTFLIEAALIAANINPGVYRQSFAFEKWRDYEPEILDEIYNDDSQEREFTHKIYGYDNNIKANAIATNNVKAAGVTKDVILKVQPFQQFEQPTEKSIIIMNPPYGERISSNDLLELYRMIGERLKHAFVGNDAWVLSYRDECFDQIGLKASVKIPLFNGALECQFRKYQLFDGKYKEFRTDNPDAEFKPKREERPARMRHHGEKVEYGRSRSRDDRRKEGGRPAFRSRDDFRQEGDKPEFRPRRADEGKDFTRNRKRDFNRDEPKRFSREGLDREKPRRFSRDEDNKRANIPVSLRYMHRRRKPEEED